jgi:hypothetical protein
MTQPVQKSPSTAVAAALPEEHLECRAFGHAWGRGRGRRKWMVDNSIRPRVARMKIPCDGDCGVKKVFRMIEQRGGLWRRVGKPYLDYSDSDYLLDSTQERPSREDCEGEMLNRDLR